MRNVRDGFSDLARLESSVPSGLMFKDPSLSGRGKRYGDSPSLAPADVSKLCRNGRSIERANYTPPSRHSGSAPTAAITSRRSGMSQHGMRLIRLGQRLQLIAVQFD